VSGPLTQPDQLREILGIAFTDEQLAAAAAPLAPSVVVAGAGTGKTSVMAARVVWLVGSGQVSPDQVLGLTFTNKAAAELAHRVRSSLARLAIRSASTDAGDPSTIEPDVDPEPTVATYHAYAGRLLRDHGLRVGLEPDARLLTEAARFQLAQRIVRHTEHALPFERTVATVTDYLMRLDSELADHLVEPETLRGDATAWQQMWAEIAKPQAKVVRAADAMAERLALLDLVERFRSAKRDRDVVDFGDQIRWAAQLAGQHVGVGVAERSKFAVVLLDEYQDTSVAQRILLQDLFGGGHAVTAVGDPFQAIYGWRGASVRNIETFPTDFPQADGQPARRYPLGQNNRSDERILVVANWVADPLRELHPAAVPLRPRPQAEAVGEVVAAMLATYDDEVGFVVDDVATRIAAGLDPGQVAVLMRRRAEFAAYYAAFVAHGIPVEVVGLGGLLDLPEVVDVVATLEVLDDATANPALVRLLAGPRWQVGPRDLALLGRRAARLVSSDDPAAVADELPVTEGAGDSSSPEVPGQPDADVAASLRAAVAGADPAEVVSLAEALEHPGSLPYSPQARDRFGRLAAELRSLRRHLGEPLVDLVERIIDVTGLDVELAASTTGRSARRSAALTSFVEHAGAFVDLDADASVGAFLAYLTAAREVERGLDASAPSPASSVKLMTVHKAKGLEWDVVYIPSLVADVFPEGKARPSWLSRPEVLPARLRGDAAEFPPTPVWTSAGIGQFQTGLQELAQVEERRLGYVAFTRARHTLVLTGHRWGSTIKARQPSPYLAAAVEALGLPTEGPTWAQAPADDDVNPLFDGRHQAVSWPVVLEPVARRRRDDAAALVTAYEAAIGGRVEVRDLLAAGERWRDRLALSATSQQSSAMSEADVAQIDAWDDELALLLGEVVARYPRERAVTVPVSLSTSQVMSLSSDPQAFARSLVRPMPRPPAPAARRGTRFHAWVESRFGQAALIDLDDLAVDDDLDGDDLESLKAAFLAGPYADRVPVAVEAPFVVRVGRHVLRGRIDAVYRASGEASDVGAAAQFEVVDWKTGRGGANPLQLAVYRLAWSQVAGVALEQVSAAFYYVASGEVVVADRLADEAGLAAMLDAAGGS
jgi:DNA helicase-2/ATP-dependent DNA helicase PcrA